MTITSSDLHNYSLRRPLILVGDFELVTWKQTSIVIFPTSKHKVCISLLVSVSQIKVYFHVVLSLTFLDLPICLGFLSNQRLEDVLVLLA